jgi:hypothetical protein
MNSIQTGICDLRNGVQADLTQQQFWKAHVRFGSKADVTLLNFDVRFTPNSGHPSAQSKCPLWAKSRLMHRSEVVHGLQPLKPVHVI